MCYKVRPLNMFYRILRTALLPFLTMLLFLSTVLAQRPQDKLLIWQAEWLCSGPDCLQEKFLLWPDDLRGGNGVVFVRVCSVQTLLSAFANAAVSPIEIASWVEYYYHFKSEQIMFVRGIGCNAKTNEIATTEIWWARSMDSGPQWVDGIMAKQLKLSYLGMPSSQENRLPFEGSVDYRASVRELIAELKLRPTAFGLVAGYYLDRPTRKMIRAVEESTRLLKQARISSGKYNSSLRKWPGEWTISPPDPKPNSPTIILYDIEGEIMHSS